MTKAMHQTALIVDDDPGMQRLLGDTLAAAGLASLFADDRATMKRLLASQPDLVILGLALPDAELRDLLCQPPWNPEIPLLIHTALSDASKQLIDDAIGIVDYLAKPGDSVELLARVRGLLRRRQAQPAPLPCSEMRRLHFGRWTLDMASRQLLGPDGHPAALGGSAYALLVAFLERPFEALSREQLSRALKREYAPYDRVVDVHVSQLRRILGQQDNGSGYIRTLRSEGYVFIAPVEGG